VTQAGPDIDTTRAEVFPFQAIPPVNRRNQFIDLSHRTKCRATRLRFQGSSFLEPWLLLPGMERDHTIRNLILSFVSG